MATLLVVLLHDKITFEIISLGRVLFPQCSFGEALLFPIKSSPFDIKVDANLEDHTSEDDWGAVLLYLFKER